MAKYTYMQQDGNVFYTLHPEYHKEATELTQAEGKRLYREQNIRDLLNCLSPGQTVYCDVASVSSSGMSRTIKVYIVQDGRLRNISGAVAEAIGWGWSDKTGGVIAKGCGMDMRFHLVYTLGWTLWPNGTPMPNEDRHDDDTPDPDGGYALKMEGI